MLSLTLTLFIFLSFSLSIYSNIPSKDQTRASLPICLQHYPASKIKQWIPMSAKIKERYPCNLQLNHLPSHQASPSCPLKPSPKSAVPLEPLPTALKHPPHPPAREFPTVSQTDSTKPRYGNVATHNSATTSPPPSTTPV